MCDTVVGRTTHMQQQIELTRRRPQAHAGAPVGSVAYDDDVSIRMGSAAGVLIREPSAPPRSSPRLLCVRPPPLSGSRTTPWGRSPPTVPHVARAPHRRRPRRRYARRLSERKSSSVRAAASARQAPHISVGATLPRPTHRAAARSARSRLRARARRCVSRHPQLDGSGDRSTVDELLAAWPSIDCCVQLSRARRKTVCLGASAIVGGRIA